MIVSPRRLDPDSSCGKPSAPTPSAVGAFFAMLGVVALVAACDDGGSPGLIEGPVSESSASDTGANRLCFEWRNCDCGAATNTSLDNCELGMQFAFDAAYEDAQEDGLTYDGECMTKRLNFMRERGCAPAEATFPGCSGETCLIYHGDVAEGEPCEGSPSASNCQQGLVCLGTCQQPCQNGPLDEGDTCYEDNQPTGACTPPLVCDTQDTGTCIALPEAGETCFQFQCAPGFWCDTASNACNTQTGAGGSCEMDLECVSLSCTDGACAALPEAGEPCLANVVKPCADGLGCVDGSCVEPPGAGEPCLDPTSGSAVVCQEGLICGAAQCSVTPSAPGCDDCQDPDGNCIVQFCQTPPAAVCSDNGGLLF